MKSPFTNRGSNIDPDDDRSQAVDREIELKRERDELSTQLEAWHAMFGTSQLTHAIAERDQLRKVCEALAGGEEPCLCGYRDLPHVKAARNPKPIVVTDEPTGGGIAFPEKSERELIAKLIEYYDAGDNISEWKTEIFDAICDVPESTFNKLRESIK